MTKIFKFFVNPKDYAKLHAMTNKELSILLDGMYMRNHKNEIVLRNNPNWIITPKTAVPEMNVFQKIKPENWSVEDEQNVIDKLKRYEEI